MPRSARSIVSGVVPSPGGVSIGFDQGNKPGRVLRSERPFLSSVSMAVSFDPARDCRDLFRSRNYASDRTACLPEMGMNRGVYASARGCVGALGNVGR